MIKQLHKQKLLLSGLLIMFVLSQTILMDGKTLAAKSNTTLINFCSYVQRRQYDTLAGSATRRVEPKYPEEAKKKGIKGGVIVEVKVDEEGKVIAAKALTGHKLLRSAAIEAAKGWRFTPTQLSGKPVKVVGTITFVFKDVEATK
jgi:TonB family protein